MQNTNTDLHHTLHRITSRNAIDFYFICYIWNLKAVSACLYLCLRFLFLSQWLCCSKLARIATVYHNLGIFLYEINYQLVVIIMHNPNHGTLTVCKGSNPTLPARSVLRWNKKITGCAHKTRAEVEWVMGTYFPSRPHKQAHLLLSPHPHMYYNISW